MIKHDLQPVSGVMAYVARLRGRNVCQTFAASDRAVMTVFTHIRSLPMVNRSYVGLPTRACGMARFTQIGGHRMGSGFVGGISSVMTGGATIGGLVMWERCEQWHPIRAGGMT
jgi:hypothetical protein